MKIVRFMSEEGHLLYGVCDPAKPGEARIISGDIFGDYEITDKYIKIKEYCPPVDPCNILAVGLNYRKHADEIGMAYPENPVLFIKAATSVVGHLSPILLPAAGPERVDYEGELAVIIGKKAKNVSPSEVMDCILGYTCSNDVSARDWQFEKQNQQWARGKSFDTFCPLGPYLVTSDEIPNPHSLRIQTLLNGNICQDSYTSDMVFDIRALVSDLSRSMTLMPGTIILTGTPEGVGFTRKSPIYLQEGDIITINIEHVGELTNPVKKEVLA